MHECENARKQERNTTRPHARKNANKHEDTKTRIQPKKKTIRQT